MAAAATVDTRPTTLAGFVRLCEAHGAVKVRRQDSLDVHNCEEGTDRFLEKYCQGQTEVPLKELIPFIRSGHDYWVRIMEAVYVALSRRKVLPPRFGTKSRYYGTDFMKIRKPDCRRIVDLG